MRAHPRAGLVPFEGVHAVLAHELETPVFKPRLILGIREVQRRARRDDAHFLRLRRAFLRPAITAQRRNPNAQMRAQRVHLCFQAGQARRKFVRILHPQALGRTVPAVIHEIRLHRHAALFHQLRIKCFHHVHQARLIQRISEVIPAIINQKRFRGPRAFPFHVAEERAPELAGRGHAGHRAKRIGAGRRQFQFRGKSDPCLRAAQRIFCTGHFHAKKHTRRHHWTAWHRPDGLGRGNPHIRQLHAVQRNGLFRRGELNGLAQVIGPVA